MISFKNDIGPKRLLLPMAMILAYGGACARGTVFEKRLTSERKPDTAGEGDERTNFGNDEEHKLVFEGSYEFLIRRHSDHKVVCRGDAQIRYFSDKQTKTSGLAECDQSMLPGVSEINLNDILTGETITLPGEKILEMGLDERLSYVVQEGLTKFFPAKPNMVGPFIQNPSNYENLDITEKIFAKVTTKDGVEKSGRGQVRVKVLGTDIDYTPSGYPQMFEDVIHWGVYAQGFSTISAKAFAKLYSTIEYYWTVKPIRILNVHIEGPVSDFRDGYSGWAADYLYPKGLSIDLNLRDFEHAN